jgi:transposase
MLTLSTEQEQALAALSRSPRRDEADRARAILMSAAGKASTEIAPLLGVRAEQVRRWRARFRHGGAAGLRTRPHPGRPDTKAQAALAVVHALQNESARPTRPALDVSWTCPRLAQEVERRTGVKISAAHLSVVLRQKGAIDASDRATLSTAGRTSKRSSARV